MSILRRARRGVKSPFERVRGQRPREKNFYLRKRVIYVGRFSAHGFLPMVFYFQFKESGLLTNLGHLVRVLDVVGSYMYIVL